MPAGFTRRWLLLAGGAALSGCASTPIQANLDASQQSLVLGAQAYLDGLKQFQAEFSQSGAFGGGNGWLWVDRPGRLRISYAGPRAQQMVARDGRFVIYNPANGATSTMPVSRTPLGLLLADRVTLSGTVAVTRFDDRGDDVSLTLADRTHPAQGTLTVVLRKHPWLLTRVDATDIRGRSFSLELSALDTHPVLTPALFQYPGNLLPAS